MASRREWQYAVHQKFGQRLRYYLLIIGPTFARRRMVEMLRVFLAESAVTHYAYHEVFGSVDLILKVWLPIQLTAFDDLLEQYFRDSNIRLTIDATFESSAQAFHWLWPELPVSIGPTRRPTSSNNSEIDITEITSSDPDTTVRLGTLGFWRDVPSSQGIKFFITIPVVAGRDMSRRFVEAVVETLRNESKIREKEIYVETHSERRVLERGAHRNQDERTILFIEGLIEISDYPVISRVNNAITAQGGLVDIRTTTFLVGSPDEASYVSNGSFARPPKKARSRRSVEYYLDALESDELEHKGSLEFDMDRYLAKGEREPQKALLTKILTTISAFLNSRKTNGGDLLIGVLEDHRYKGPMRERMKDFAVVGNKCVCGIEFDYDKDRWDGFLRKLEVACSTRIGPSFSEYMQIHPLKHGDKDLCLIQVTSLPRRQWAYCDDRFFIRRGGITEMLSAQAQEIHQRLDPEDDDD